MTKFLRALALALIFPALSFAAPAFFKTPVRFAQTYPLPPNVGLFAARPTFCSATGQTYYATDNSTLYYSTVAGTSCTWAAITGGGGGGSPGGSSGNVQYNAGGSFGGVGGFTFDGTSIVSLGVAGTSVGGVSFANASTGAITIKPPTGALGTVQNTLQAAADTFVYRATTDTLTNKTISGSSNTLSNIANASLTNPAITIAGTSVSLGGSTSSFPNPGAIGGGTPAAGTFTALTATGLTQTAASASGGAGLNLPQGAAPTSPNDGDLWTTASGIFVRIAGSTVGPLSSGGGGSGTVSSSTIGYIGQYTGATTIGTPSPLLDNGVTTTNALTYGGSAGIAAASFKGTSATNAGMLALQGNTSNPTLATNSVGFLGPTSASFTDYYMQLPSTAPSGTQYLGCGTPSSNVSTCTWGSGGGSVTSIATTAPITGGTITTTGTIACATCATTTNGGAISFDKSNTGLINPTADATFTYISTSATGLSLAGTAPASVSTSTGTNASSVLNVTGPAGGASSNATGTGGVGGSPSVTAGAGGAGTGTNAVGGAGGTYSITTGAGGASNGSGVNSNGGNLSITLGAPGTGGGGTAGKNGVVSVSGTGAGFDYLTQGTAITTANTNIPANSIIDQAPTAVTAYENTRPGAAATGLAQNVNSSNVVTQTFTGAFGAVSATSQTGTISAATICAATANTACGQAGQYKLSLDVWGSGTACSSVTAGKVVFTLTWTDAGGSTHTAVPWALYDYKSAAQNVTGTFNFNTALTTEGANGIMVLSTNGTAITYTATYTACTTGTGTFNVHITTEQLQ